MDKINLMVSEVFGLIKAKSNRIVVGFLNVSRAFDDGNVPVYSIIHKGSLDIILNNFMSGKKLLIVDDLRFKKLGLVTLLKKGLIKKHD